MSDSELLSIFWVEVGEYLQALNNSLLQIEMIAADDDAAFNTHLREMNRVAHSMKGAARAVGIGVIERIAHFMEEVFDSALRDKLELSPETCDTLYDGLDLIQNVANGEENHPEAVDAVLVRLEEIVISGKFLKDATTDSRQMQAVTIEQAAVPDEEKPDDPLRASSEVAIVPPVTDTQATLLEPVDHPTLAVRTVPSLLQGLSPADTNTTMARPVEETVRVTVSKLDRLMAEATELFVAKMHGDQQHQSIDDLRRVHARWQREWRSVRAAFIRLVRRLQDNPQAAGSELPILLKFLETNQRFLIETNRQLTQLSQSIASHNTHLSVLTDQLQNEISAMRLLPFESITGGFYRMVRDLARDMSKQIQLDVVGGAVEIDKTVLEALKDPLMHLLRNAIDHGIEHPDDRQRAGKSPVGRIEMSVEQRGSEIILTVSDDGNGIDLQRVRKSIVRNRILSETEAASLGDDELRGYIFHPGLSTSDQVTAVSGRGLGMDIVRDRVESLRGRVSIRSKLGEGTATILSVPVSLTRIRCVLLKVGEQEFSVPSAMVTRMGTWPRSDVFTAEGREMILLNGRPTLLASLSAVLDVPAAVEDDEIKVIALQASNRTVAFEVDDLHSEQELVLKPLGPELIRAPFVAGAALMGDGRVIVMLDSNDLVRRATGVALPRRRATMTLPIVAQRRMRVLVVDDSITTRTLEKNILETAGFEVHVAINGVEAWEMLAETDFDVVISDVEMPAMNGLELTARIKASSQYRHIPVILLTSLGKPEQREAGLRAGADGYLVKSRFDQGELLQTIHSVV